MTDATITFTLKMPDGTEHQLSYPTAAPDLAKISALSEREIAAFGVSGSLDAEMAARAASAEFCEPIEVQFRRWMRRVGRDS